jgi:hypothetical protein
LIGSKVFSKIAIFIFGFCLGGFISVSIIREAVPLRDHVYVIGIYIIYILPIIAALFFWHKSIIKAGMEIFGEEKGDFLGTIFTFIDVSILVILILVIGIFYSSFI